MHPKVQFYFQKIYKKGNPNSRLYDLFHSYLDEMYVSIQEQNQNMNARLPNKRDDNYRAIFAQ